MRVTHNSDVDELLLAFEMLFKVGAYYPANHQRSHMITERVMKTMGSFLDGHDELVLALDEDILQLQGHPVALDTPGARSMFKQLARSDIARLELSADIGHDDLHTLVELLPTYWKRNACDAPSALGQLDEIPDTIRVRQREFLSAALDVEQEDLWHQTRDKVSDLLGELAGLELDGKRVALCRALADRFLCMTDSGEALTLTTMTSRMKDSPDLEHMLELDVNEDQATDVPALQQSLDKLTTMLDRILEADDNDIAHESLEKLIGLLNKAVPDFWVAAIKGNRVASTPPPANHTLSIDELRHAIDLYESGTIRPGGISPGRGEMLAIHLRLFSRKQTVRAQDRLELEIGTALARDLRGQEQQILLKGLVEILESSPPAVRNRNLSFLMTCIRKSSAVSSLQVLYDVDQLMGPDRLARIWPFLVNEVLIGRQSESNEIFKSLCNTASSLPSTQMDPLVPILLDLDANREKLADESILLSPNLALFPTYAAIMRADDPGHIGDLVARCLDKYPPPWLGIALIPLIKDHHDAYRPLYAELLSQAGQGDPSQHLLEMAATALIERLPELEPRQRKETWVPNTIRTFARLPGDAGAAVLSEIHGNRRLFVIPIWPPDCRRAAKEAMREIKARPQSHTGETRPC